VVRFRADSWQRVGPALPAARTMVRFAIGDSSRVELTAVQQGPSGRRWLWRLDHGRWRSSVTPLVGAGFGPVLSGAIRDHGRVYFPVVAARGSNWPFSIYVYDARGWRRLGGRALNRGDGKAQGTLSRAAGALWATWQQNDQRRDGRFNTTVFVARIRGQSARVATPRRLWHGVSLGPSDATVVEGSGRAWALYVIGKRGGLRPIVSALP